ncbi:hypothetical protein [Mammaliicoccus lentus]|uniref:hypothetical protein n=1 Tax=Mammaliicoccus lentus TaxID=42858 RepID=UPI001072D922|nr:hypothetical protein [Mammaliicoccus lentus]MBF0793326.1 hypothetical protein [Mammaliicoccus lentus]TFV17828.1 hypothetical protein E4T78_01585 [Mammaliicoccus lentus]
MRARKKPIEVEVMQFTDESIDKILEWGEGKITPNVPPMFFTDYLSIDTLEGTMRVNYKDYIVKGVEGEFYPCKPDIFHKTYELIEEE